MSRLSESALPILALLALLVGTTRSLDNLAEQAADGALVIRLTDENRHLRFDDSDAVLDDAQLLVEGSGEVPAAVQQARALEKAGKRSDAIAALTAALASAPDDAVAIELAQLHLRGEHPEEALAVVRSARAASRDPSALLFLEGVALAQLERHEEAERAYRDVLSRSPEHFEANYNLGLLLLSADRAEDARAPLEAAVGAAGGQRKARALFALGVTHAKRGDKALAERTYRRSIEFHPAYLLPRLNLAILYGMERRDEAEEMLAEVLRLQGDFAPAFFLQGRLASRANENEKALRLYQQAARADPGFYKARYNAGILELELGRPADAERTFEELSGDFLDRPEPWFNLGRLAYQRNDHERARAMYEKALAVSRGRYELAALNLALVDSAEDRYEEALARLDQVLEKNPKYATALVNRGVVKRKLGRDDEARQDFERALELEPRSASARYNLARLLVDTKDVEGGVAQYREVLRIEPGHRGAGVNLGVELMDRGDLEGARSAFEAVLRAAPHHIKALFNLGRLEGKAGRWDQAVERYLQVLAIEPDNLKARRNLGVAYAKLDRLEDAVSEYAIALEQDPELRSVRFNHALALKKLGRAEEAEAAMARCVALDPGYAPCLRSLALLQCDDHRCREALERLEGRVKKSSDADLMAVYARALADANRPDDARTWLALAQEKAPEDAEVQRAAKALSSPPAASP